MARKAKPDTYSSRTAEKFVIRLPEGMRDCILLLAKTNHRSMNSEIVRRLEESILASAKEQNPLMDVTVETDGTFSATPNIEQWNPQAGMLVCCKLDASQVYNIVTIHGNAQGVLFAELVHVDGRKAGIPLSQLRPFFVS